jgi:hypothetical protein
MKNGNIATVMLFAVAAFSTSSAQANFPHPTVDQQPMNIPRDRYIQCLESYTHIIEKKVKRYRTVQRIVAFGGVAAIAVVNNTISQNNASTWQGGALALGTVGGVTANLFITAGKLRNLKRGLNFNRFAYYCHAGQSDIDCSTAYSLAFSGEDQGQAEIFNELLSRGLTRQEIGSRIVNAMLTNQSCSEADNTFGMDDLIERFI